MRERILKQARHLKDMGALVSYYSSQLLKIQFLVSVTENLACTYIHYMPSM